MRRAFAIAVDAFYRFLEDDGWAIASHIALSTLMALFPFLILVTALAAFLGSKNLADEVANLLLETWPQEVAAPIAGAVHRVLTTTRGDVLTVAVFVVHEWLPAGHPRFRQIAIGILATLILWLAGVIVFGRYLAEFASTYVTYYAGLASAMIALVFLYLTASIFMYGGE